MHSKAQFGDFSDSEGWEVFVKGRWIFSILIAKDYWGKGIISLRKEVLPI